MTSNGPATEQTEQQADNARAVAAYDLDASTQAQILFDLVPTTKGAASEDWYLEQSGDSVGYLYASPDGWVVGVIDPATNDIGPMTIAYTKALALGFAAQELAALRARVL